MTGQTDSPKCQLLLVRSWDVAPAAIEAANRLLAFRSAAEGPVEVLGLWRRRQLEEGLPLWTQGAAFVGLRESCSLSGLWTMCLIDGPSLRQGRSPQARRLALLHELVSRAPGLRIADEVGVFRPAFAASEPADAVPPMLQQLKDHHPDLVGDRWLAERKDARVLELGGRVLPRVLFCPSRNMTPNKRLE